MVLNDNVNMNAVSVKIVGLSHSMPIRSLRGRWNTKGKYIRDAGAIILTEKMFLDMFGLLGANGCLLCTYVEGCDLRCHLAGR